MKKNNMLPMDEDPEKIKEIFWNQMKELSKNVL